MALETFGISLGFVAWLRNQLSIPRAVIVEPKHNMLYRLSAIITPSASFGQASVLPHHGKAAVSTSVVMKKKFGSQPGRTALRYEKRAKEDAALKKKEAAEAVKKVFS